MLTLEQVKIFARAAHGTQTWGKGEPYSVHLGAVENNIVYAASSEVSVHNWLPELRMAAWLHDILEDTTVTTIQLNLLVPASVVGLAIAVTNEPGKNRKERHEKTYPKILSMGTLAIALKLADRIANVRKSVAEKSDLLNMYVKEHDDFVIALRRAWELSTMWNELNNLMIDARLVCQK